ncbi:hypothetical protein D3C81_1164570 [compost metagenome]
MFAEDIGEAPYQIHYYVLFRHIATSTDFDLPCRLLTAGKMAKYQFAKVPCMEEAYPLRFL